MGGSSCGGGREPAAEDQAAGLPARRRDAPAPAFGRRQRECPHSVAAQLTDDQLPLAAASPADRCEFQPDRVVKPRQSCSGKQVQG